MVFVYKFTNDIKSFLDRRDEDIATYIFYAYVAFIVFPIIALGSYSYVRNIDNTDGVMPFMLAMSSDALDFKNWSPYTGLGAPALAQGFPARVFFDVFQFLSPWLGYVLIVVLCCAAGLYGVYKYLREYTGVSDAYAKLFAIIIVGLSDPSVLMNAPLVLTPAFSWLAIHSSKNHKLLYSAASCVVFGLLLGFLSSSFLYISFWFVISFLMIFTGLGASWRAFFLSCTFALAALIPVLPEFAVLLINAPLSHRVSGLTTHYNVGFWDALLAVATSLTLSLSFLSIIFFKAHDRNHGLIRIAFLALAICIFTVFVAQHSFHVNLFPSGFSTGRLIFLLNFFALINFVFLVHHFSSQDHRAWAATLVLVLFISPLQFVNVSYTTLRSWIEGGNFTRFEMPQLEAIAQEADHKPGNFRVDAVNFTLGSGFLPAYKLEAAGGYLNIYPGRYSDLFYDLLTPEKNISDNVKGVADLASYYKTHPNRLKIDCGVFSSTHNALMLDQCIDVDIVGLLNIRYLFSRNPLHHENLTLVSGPQEAWYSLSTSQKVTQSFRENFGAQPHIFIYRLKHHAPRVFFADDVRIVDNQEELSRLLTSLPLMDLMRDVLLLKRDAEARTITTDNINAYKVTGSSDFPVRPEIRSTSFEGDAFNISLATPRPGYVIVSNSFAVGWSVKVNGKASEILPSYGALWAVMVPEGASEISFHYDAIPGGQTTYEWLYGYAKKFF